jgi:type I restriction enzyme R subunit
MNEAETRAELIDPALREAGWGVVDGSRVRREVITLGRLEGGGRRGKQDIADYVLIHRDQKLAVIEAKRRSAPDTEGVGQAKRYAGMLQARFAYSTNGAGIYRIDMRTGAEGYVERYPTPDELWDASFAEESEWRDRFAAVPFESRGGAWDARYYQHNAINNVLEAIARGQDRILLTMATGDGQDRGRLPDRLEALPEPLEPEPRAHAAAAHPLPRRPQHPGEPGVQRLLRLPRGRAGAHLARRDPE